MTVWHLPPDGVDPWTWPWGPLRAVEPDCSLCGGTGLVEDPSAYREHRDGWAPCPAGCPGGPDAGFRAQAREFMRRNHQLLRRLDD